MDPVVGITRMSQNVERYGPFWGFVILHMYRLAISRAGRNNVPT